MKRTLILATLAMTTVLFAVENDKTEPTALLWEAVRDGDTATVKALIEAGADVNATGGEYGRTMLMGAAWAGAGEIIRALAEAGADVNARGEDRVTALNAAIGTKRGDGPMVVVKALLDAGADVNAYRDDGETTGLIGLASILGGEDILWMLIDAGADVDARDTNGETALMQMAQHGAHSSGRGFPYEGLEAMMLLLEAGADANVQDNEGKTALDKAWDDHAIELLTAAMEGRELPPLCEYVSFATEPFGEKIVLTRLRIEGKPPDDGREWVKKSDLPYVATLPSQGNNAPLLSDAVRPPAIASKARQPIPVPEPPHPDEGRAKASPPSCPWLYAAPLLILAIGGALYFRLKK